MEEIRTIDGLALEELETQRLDLLPDREEMLVWNSPYGKDSKQLNLAYQNANANANGAFSTAIAANGATQSNSSTQIG